jgi:hypothetical protein
MNGLTLVIFKDIQRVIALILMLLSQSSLAAEDVWQTSEASPLWQNECGSCHMAFPPALLTQGNWKQLMQELDTHFGVNASLDTKTREEIAAFLERNSGTNWARSADSLRITQTGWFVKRHASGIQMLEKGRIKTLADCAACHK